MTFEHISEPVRRVIYSCETAITHNEKRAYYESAKKLTRAAIRAEARAKDDAQNMRNPAIKGSLRALATFVALADAYENAVMARRACERIEERARIAVTMGPQ